MPRQQQSRKRLAQLIEQFPALGRLRSLNNWLDDNSNLRRPITEVYVQKAHPDMMFFQADNLRPDGTAFVMHQNRDRGSRTEHLCAVDKNDQVIEDMHWSYPADREKYAKDIFRLVDPEQVAYLVWVTRTMWHSRPSKVFDELGVSSFGNKLKRVELRMLVYPRPKDMSWLELVAQAEREKFEREDAHNHPPKEMPDLPGIAEALREGFRMHAFLSGGGLRVVSLRRGDEDRGYGEHPHIEVALCHLDEDYLAGGLPYSEMYCGPNAKYSHYLTGATLPTSNLDSWVSMGRTFDCWQEGEDVVLVLHGHKHTEIPDIVKKNVDETGEPSEWLERGNLYQTLPSRFPNGDPCYSTRVLLRSDDGRDPWFYPITKTGRGSTFWAAMLAAFEAPDVEVIEERVAVTAAADAETEKPADEETPTEEQ